MYLISVFVTALIFVTVEGSNIRPSRLARDSRGHSELFRREDVDFDALPECAKPHCNASDSMSPSRLGCVGPTLTKSCLCDEAVTPLACVPDGPSSEDNCWYNVEDWFAGVCNNSIPRVAQNTMPECMADCATNWLRTKGCKTDTRNCFCKLDKTELVKSIEQCRKAGCMKHMKPVFEVAFWRENICSQGEADKYDEVGYQKRKKMVRNVQIVVPIFLLIVLIPIVGFGVIAIRDEDRRVGIPIIVGAFCVALLVLVPIYIAI